MDSDQNLRKGLIVIKMQRLMWLHNFKLLWNSSSSYDIIERNLQKIAVHNNKHCIRILNSAMLCRILMPEICAFQTSFMVSKCIQPLFKLICILIGQSPHFQADFLIIFYLYFYRINIDFSLISWGFGKFPQVLTMWFYMQAATLALYPAFILWIQYRHINPGRSFCFIFSISHPSTVLYLCY